MSYKLVNLKNKKGKEFLQAFAGIPENEDSLDLRYNELGHRTNDELAQAFAVIPVGITSIDLRHNGFKRETGSELIELFQAMPANIQSVHLYDENNELAHFKKITSLKEKVALEIARLTRSLNSFWVNISLVETSETKIKALEELQLIFQNGFGKSQDKFQEELHQWKKSNWDFITKQRNVIHRFFIPNHKTASAMIIDDIFVQLGVAAKFETDHSPTDPGSSTAPNLPFDPNSPTGLTNPLLGDYKGTKPFTAKKVEEFNELIKKINKMVLEEEVIVKAQPKKEDGLPKVSEAFIQDLIVNIKDVTFSKDAFWYAMDQMSRKDIKLFVSKLNSNKNGKHGLSVLDSLWRQFKGFEFEPLQKEKKKNKFIEIIEGLSEEQLKASFNSSDFLTILNDDMYAEALVNTINYKQMALFASDRKRHDILDKMVKKLKPAPDLFSKLVVIMPYSSGVFKTNLENQLSHLPQEASFNIKVVDLSSYYTDNNLQIEIEKAALEKAALEKAGAGHVGKKPPEPSKWKVNADYTPKYNAQPINKIEWTEQAFEKFIQELNASTYTFMDTIIEDLNSMTDDRIRMMVELASSSTCKDLLQHLWAVESKILTANSHKEARIARLKIVLENLSEAQLKESITDDKFWKIFAEPQQPYRDMAAEILTTKQFTTIISNLDLDRHTDLALIIVRIKKDTPGDKKRLKEIIEAILPHTTPWLVAGLEVKINELFGVDKKEINRLKAELKKYLNESMQRNDVMIKYIQDDRLDKKGVAELFVADTLLKIDAFIHEETNLKP